MKVLGVIGARGGSKTVPQKNMRLLGGKPLIAYTIEEALKSKLISRLILSTDSEKIAAIGRSYGIEAPFMRPTELADDKTPLIPDVLRHAVIAMKEQGFELEVAVMLQPTCPFRKADIIDEAIQKLEGQNVDWVVSVSPVKVHPYRMKIIENGLLKNFIADEKTYAQRQELPEVWWMNGAVYAVCADVLLSKNPLVNKKWAPVFMDEKSSVDIDTEDDFAAAEAFLKFKADQLNNEHRET